MASASADGVPCLVSLSFDRDGEALLMATPTDSPTGRNLGLTRAVQLGPADTGDVSVSEGEVEILEIEAPPRKRGDWSAARTGFDSRAPAAPDPSERCDHDRTRCRQDRDSDLHPHRRHVSAL